MEYTIENSELTLTASTFGGELHSLTTREGLPLLWDGREEIWPRRAPVCFPWVGAIEDGWYEDRGFQYREADRRHGFVRDMEHLLVERTPERLSFRLEWPGSLAMWPWAFWFETVHTLEGSSAVTTCTVENRAGRAMPVQFGFHPALRCPFLPGTAVEEYQVRFESGRVVALDSHIFDDDSIRYTDVGAWARLEHKGTGKYLEVETAGYPNVLLWSKPGIPGFVCIEPWQGYPGLGHDLMGRPGAQLMEHGERKNWRQAVTVNL